MLEKTEGAEAAAREGPWGFSFRPEAVLVTNTCGRLVFGKHASYPTVCQYCINYNFLMQF